MHPLLKAGLGVQKKDVKNSKVGQAKIPAISHNTHPETLPRRSVRPRHSVASDVAERRFRLLVWGKNCLSPTCGVQKIDTTMCSAPPASTFSKLLREALASLSAVMSARRRPTSAAPASPAGAVAGFPELPQSSLEPVGRAPMLGGISGLMLFGLQWRRAPRAAACSLAAKYPPLWPLAPREERLAVQIEWRPSTRRPAWSLRMVHRVCREAPSDCFERLDTFRLRMNNFETFLNGFCVFGRVLALSVKSNGQKRVSSHSIAYPFLGGNTPGVPDFDNVPFVGIPPPAWTFLKTPWRIRG